jgi:xanthine dehydrogenase molybdenum-binding subunit
MKKDSEGLRVVGSRAIRVDGLDKVLGRQRYAFDVSLPGMLHAKILRSPHPHAKIRKIDTSKAEAMPGVKAVITFEDVPKKKYNPWLDCPHWVEPRDRQVLTDHPRYFGDGIAAVAAIDADTAAKAIDQIKVEYEKFAAVFEVEEAMKKGAPLLHENAENNIVGIDSKWKKGDITRGFEEAAVVVSGSYKTQDMQHVPMETYGTVAAFDPFSKNMTIYSTTQNAFPLMSRICHVLEFNFPVRVIAFPLGGAFGGKHELFQHDAVACLLSVKTGKPVRCFLTREESFTVNKRYGAKIELKLGAKKDGTFQACRGVLIANAGAYAINTLANMAIPFDMMVSLYHFENYQFEAIGVYTNGIPNTPFRGFGNPQGMFALEQLIDMLAEELNMDRTEISTKNMIRAGDIIPWTGKACSTTGLRECIEIGRERIAWHRRKRLPTSAAVVKTGIGMACMAHVTSCALLSEGWNESSAAIVKLNSDGTVTLVTGASDNGQGIFTTLSQVAAEEFGLPMEKVIYSQKYTDTETQPWDWGNFGSRCMYLVGTSTKLACEDAKKKLLPYAAEKLGLDPNGLKLEFKNGRVYDKSNLESFVDFAELVHFANETSKQPGQLLGFHNFVPTQNPMIYGAQFVEVQVNTETGEIRIPKFIAVHDVGKAINPTIVEGQIEGGVVQGLGQTLMEELKIDKDTGRYTTTDFLSYRVPRSTDIPPELKVICVETMDPYGPYGAKSVGEAPMVPTLAAVANAIYNAIGVRINELPITPERILRALDKI